MGKREIQRKARQFASALLHAQDLPDWFHDHDMPQEAAGEFLAELRRISTRIRPIDRTNSKEK